MKFIIILTFCALISDNIYANDTFKWVRLDGPNTVINCFTIHKNVLYAATEKGIYKTPDEGISWSNAITINDTIKNIPYSAIYSYKNILFAGTRKIYSGLYESTDDGISWNNSIRHLGRLDTVYWKVPIRCILSGMSYLFLGYDQGISRTSDLGKTWSIKAYNAEQASNKAESSTSFTPQSEQISPWEPYTLIIADSLIVGGYLGSVRISKDTGRTDSKYVGQPVPSAPVGALYYLGNGELLAGVSYNDGVYRSLDMGKTWVSYSEGITGIKAVSVYSFCAVGNYLFAGSDNGMYFSTNNGKKWEMMNDGLLIPSDSTNGDTIWTMQYYNGYLFAGTNRGIFRANLVAESVEDIYGLENRNETLGISPNPTRESFFVSAPNDAIVTVQDIFGHMLYKGEGGTISTSGWSAGLYFVGMTTSTRRTFEKMIISR